MKLVDPHIDVADLACSFNFKIEDLLSPTFNGPVSLPMMQEAEIIVAGFSLYFDSSFVKSTFYDGVKEFYHFYSELEQRSGFLQKIESATDLERLCQGEIGYFLTIEGLDCLRTPEDFDEFYDLGVRSFGFTWCNDNSYACGGETRQDRGLTDAGHEVLRRMNERKKLILDVSHLSPKSITDISDSFEGVIVATHSNARTIHDNPHNLIDDQIEIIKQHDGVVGIFPLAACVGPLGTFEELWQHIDYIASKWDLRHVGLCSDIYPLKEFPFCHEHKTILIMSELQNFLSSKMSKAELERVLYGNWERVLLNAL